MRLTLLASLLFAFSIPSLADGIKTERYIVTFPQHDRVPYQGAFRAAFPQGFPLGVGSGLSFLKRENGKLIFATLTDRGPNADAPETDGREAKIFAAPEFTPQLVTLTVSDHDAQASDARPLQEQGLPISGLPLPDNFLGASGEIPLSDTLARLRYDRRGLDTEGITPDGNGGFWLCDEYGPFIVHVDDRGNILDKKGPTPAAAEKSVASGLPAIIKWRQPNRGFEGITRMPDGRIIAAVQSTLDIDGKSKNSAQFTRLVSYDPATGNSAMYGYPIDIASYKKAKDAKIGDIVAFDNQRLLVIEQGTDREKQPQNKIWLVDLSQASDLTHFDQQPAEFDSAQQLHERGITLASKTLVADLRQLGWQQEKAEGLALVDSRTLAITNDNDFGLTADKQADGRLGLKPLSAQEAASELWLLKLPQPLQ
ncbi:esterase-like activity of phytase family protein [Pantoea sp. B65]|uniref:esterase-like activity of phytase family protein n=1 Tax=Pantoea sp. B65 TaxID=2813359 RepID=UPI0039B612D7